MATQMRSLGVDRLVVSKLLNHAEAGITKTYDRYAADAREGSRDGKVGSEVARDHLWKEAG